MYGKTEADPVLKNSPISEAINDAFGAIGALEENVASLGNKLAPVLFDIPENAADKGETDRSITCPLEGEIRRLQHRISSINNYVAGLSRRVAL
jgi:hypothetical protein